jgi:hypothetical protein
MRRYGILLLWLITSTTFAHAPVWSKTGHRVIGEVAAKYLKSRTQRAISELLDGQSLAAVSNYADEIKADRRYKDYSPWHYVNFPADKTYSEVTPSPNGDVVAGIQKCIEVLRDAQSARTDKVFYLKMLIHLMGDLHQPMHIGREEDKGGNTIQLQWFGRGSNLHKLWDADMINDYGMSYTELANSLPVLSSREIRVIQEGNILDWVEETQEVTNKLYASVSVGEKLGYSYSYTYWPLVEEQLQRGGLRLARVLNDLFS